jgi:hypothetical protein
VGRLTPWVAETLCTRRTPVFGEALLGSKKGLLTDRHQLLISREQGRIEGPGSSFVDQAKRRPHMSKARSKERVKRQRVTLSLEAPAAEQVIVAGDFNQWNIKIHSMKKNKNGVWQKVVMVPPGRYEYKFMVDGQWQNDPGNDQACYNCFGTHNNVLIIPPK